MPTQPTTPQLQYYKKQGSDGKWYQTQASSPDEAKVKLAKAMPASQTDPTKNYGFTMQNIRKNVGEGFKAAYEGTKEMGKTLLNPKTSGNVNRALDQFVFKPGDEQLRKAKSDYNNKRLMESAGHFIAAGIPFLGPIAASIGEQAGTGDIGGAAAKGSAMYLAGKGTELVAGNVSKAASDALTPEALRQRAASLDTKVLKTAETGARDKTAIGLQVANEQIVGTMKQLPTKIEQVRSAKQAKVEALAKYHDSKGRVVDAEQSLAPLLRNTAARLNAQGLLTGQVRSGVQSLLKRITTKWDFAANKEVPRDLSKLKVSEAIELTKGLEDLSSFGKDAPAAIEIFARQTRQVINDAIDKVDPEIGKTRAEQSRLIKARDAAAEHYTKMLNDKVGVARGIMYSNAPTIGMWLGLRALGLMTPVTALGSVILIKTLAESALSRTARAALYAKAADLFERASPALQGVSLRGGGPSGPQMGRGPTLGPGGPKLAANAPAAPSTAPRGGLPAMPPANTGPAAPRGLPESATRARAGSGDYVKGTTKQAAEPKPMAGQSGAKGTSTSSPAAPQTKAMLDRLDTLLERKPKSGAENNAIKREIGEIKQILSGKASATEQSAINKRIADRERLASKRSAAGAVQTGNQTGASGEAVSQGASPEMRAIALDAGYKALAHYEGGAEMVKALKSTAKAMQKIDPSYDEVEKLTEALQVLKQVSGDLDAGKP